MAEGTKVVIHLKESCSEFADYNTVREIIKKYSSFVGSDLSLDGNKANDLKPGNKCFIMSTELKKTPFHNKTQNHKKTFTLDFLVDIFGQCR